MMTGNRGSRASGGEASGGGGGDKQWQMSAVIFISL